MYLKMYLEYVLALSLFTAIHCILLNEHYLSSQSIASTPNSEFQTHITRRSKIECAVACGQENSCNSFSFNKETRQCSMSSGITENISDRVYYSKCLANLGYNLYKLQNILLCLKIIATDVHQTIAKNDCENDGGHLLVIANEEMHLFVKTIVTAAGCGSVWVDGRDVYSNDTMISWTGEKIPYINWAQDEPSNGNQDCLFISSVKDFNFRDAVCSSSIYHGYICQID